MGRTEKRELVSRLTALLLHLLKWQFQPAGPPGGFPSPIPRNQLVEHLDDNPSLKSQLDTAMASAYRYARRDAARETSLDIQVFPEICPWTFEQILDPEFWPEHS